MDDLGRARVRVILHFAHSLPWAVAELAAAYWTDDVAWARRHDSLVARVSTIDVSFSGPSAALFASWLRSLLVECAPVESVRVAHTNSWNDVRVAVVHKSGQMSACLPTRRSGLLAWDAVVDGLLALGVLESCRGGWHALSFDDD
jgi:hypothetical protein